MERALQYWDDLDDLIGIVALSLEHIRRAVLFALATLCFLAGLIGAASLASLHPPLGLAFMTLLLIILMYRSVTGPRPTQAANAPL